MDVEEHGAGSIGDISGVKFALGETPEEPGIDCAEGEFASISEAARAGHIVEDPGDLGCGEIGIDQKSRTLLDQPAVTLAAQLLAESGGAAILPDDGVADGTSCFAIPDDGCLALIGDADGGDVGRLRPGFGECFERNGNLRKSNLIGIVLDPSGLRKDLIEFLLGHSFDSSTLIKEESSRACGSLIQRQDIFHGSSQTIL